MLNVIENPDERAATLRSAWELCRQVLAVFAQVLMAGRGKDPVEFGDGVLTGRGTFQKFYDQNELKTYTRGRERCPIGQLVRGGKALLHRCIVARHCMQCSAMQGGEGTCNDAMMRLPSSLPYLFTADGSFLTVSIAVPASCPIWSTPPSTTIRIRRCSAASG